MTKDLTKGNIPKLLLGFLIPIIFGKLFQQIYNVVDAAIVGHALGVTLIGDRMLLLFLTKEDAALVSEPAMLSIYTFTYGMFFLTTVQVVRLAIQGMSFSKLALVAGMLEMAARAGSSADFRFPTRLLISVNRTAPVITSPVRCLP